MSWAQMVRRGWRALLDLLYPPQCCTCGAFVGSWWCERCRAQVAWLAPNEVEHVLALPSGAALPIYSAVRYRAPLAEAIHAFKYKATPQLAELFAALMARAWHISHAETLPFVLVPVPLHPRRQRERGYNQSELLAKALSASLGFAVARQALRRTRHTAQQAQLADDAQRQANVHGAFAANPRAVYAKPILLVDDVYTTGATLSACAEALLAAGASQVAALTLARARN
ncbi:MAG: ComF family protein [Thermoflexales bacterium]|nr:ComF family protein [Thermoflexales bacterium]